MAETDLFEEMLATYPAEKRELARKVYHRFADGDSTQFFTQLLLVLDVYARYVERIPKAAVQANQESFAILEDMRGEIAMIAKTIESPRREHHQSRRQDGRALQNHAGQVRRDDCQR